MKNKFLLFCAFIFLIGLGAELTLRLLDPQPTFRWYSYDRFGNRWNKGVSDNYFLLLPGLKGAITFNSRGERSDRDFTLQKTSAAKRVLLLGTSLTLGWPNNRGVSELLSDRFAQDDQPTDVINCSTGYANLATLLNIYRVHCAYEALDALVIALPLNAFVDGLAANSFLWGENFIDDPGKLSYLLRYEDPSKFKLHHDEFGVPSFILTDPQQARIADYYNESWFFYDHLHLARLIANRYGYVSIVLDQNFQRNYKTYFDQAFTAIPKLDTTKKLISRFRSIAGGKTKVIVLLIPTYHSFILEPRLREQVLGQLQNIPTYDLILKSPDTFAQKHYGGLGPYLDAYAEKISSFKFSYEGSDITVIDLTDDLKQGDLQSYYLADQYHLSMKGHEALAAALFRELSN
jgi:hypothetical protein